MKKTTKPTKKEVNVDVLKSVMGKEKYQEAVTQELYAGNTPEEAPELIARRIAREQSKNNR